MPSPSAQLPRYVASISGKDDGVVRVELVNRTSRRATFWVSGVAQEVGITLDGNRRYVTTMRRKGDRVIVSIGNRDGDEVAVFPDEGTS